MVIFNYVAEPPKPFNSWMFLRYYYRWESDEFGKRRDEDEYNGTTLVADGLSGDFKFTINGIERTHETEFGTCRSASITALGEIDGTELFLLSYIDKGTLYYAVYDWDGNAVKDFTALTDAKKLSGVYFNEQGDFVLIYNVATPSGDRACYSKVASGYDAPPTALTDAAFTVQAQSSMSVPTFGSLGYDPGGQALTAGDIAIGVIDTSDGSTGSAIAIKGPYGDGILVLYTGILADGETATVPVSYSVSDGTHTATGGLLTMTFTGTGSDLVLLRPVEAEALIAAGYDSLADIGGAISGFSLILDGTKLTSEALDSYIALGVTELYASEQGQMWIGTEGLDLISSKGLSFRESGAVTFSDRYADWIVAHGVAGIEQLAEAGIDTITTQVNSAKLNLDVMNAIMDNGLSFFGPYHVLTIGDSAANVFALDAGELAGLKSLGAALIDLDEHKVRNDAAAYEMLADAGYKFVKGDEIILETTVAEASTFTDEQLAAFAKMRVDYVAFTDDEMPSAALIKKITDAGITVSDPDLPSEGDDTLVGTDSDDEINALGGSDRVAGGIGNDTLLGGKGRDFLSGQDGDDVLDGGAGNDSLFGGPGADRFVFRSSSGRDWIEDFTAVDGAEHDGIDLSRIKGIDGFSDLKIKEGDYDLVTVIVNDNVRIRLYGADIEDLDATDFVF